jgi:hypothetical protein
MCDRLVLALLDCALVNAYIVHRESYKKADKKPMRHGEFLATLHAQLVNVKPSQLEQNTVRYAVTVSTTRFSWR